MFIRGATSAVLAAMYGKIVFMASVAGDLGGLDGSGGNNRPIGGDLLGCADQLVRVAFPVRINRPRGIDVGHGPGPIGPADGRVVGLAVGAVAFIERRAAVVDPVTRRKARSRYRATERAECPGAVVVLVSVAEGRRVGGSGGDRGQARDHGRPSDQHRESCACRLGARACGPGRESCGAVRHRNSLSNAPVAESYRTIKSLVDDCDAVVVNVAENDGMAFV